MRTPARLAALALACSLPLLGTGCAVITVAGAAASVAGTAVGVAATGAALAVDAAVGTARITGKAVGAAADLVVPDSKP